jgi:hypothetical protein
VILLDNAIGCGLKSLPNIQSEKLKIKSGESGIEAGGACNSLAERLSFAMEIEATFMCAYCLQVNEILVDGSGGPTQTYVEDCQVCCRPNQLTITLDEEMREALVDAAQT